MTQRSYRAVCFDLDGTLLPLDVDAFMRAYFHTVSKYVARFDVSQDALLAGIKEGTKAMALRNDSRTNADVFWECFAQYVPGDDIDWKSEFMDYYEHHFGAIGDIVTPDPAAARAIKTLVDKGYPLVLTTMPMFPRRAVEWRLEWAGVNPECFERITTFDNSTSVKPKLEYYAENLAAMDVAGSDVLMVGNNTKEDAAFQALGADVYIVTDYLLDPIGFDMDSVRKGSLADFADWVEQLPPCDNPVGDVLPGLVSDAARKKALVANKRDDMPVHSGEDFILHGEKE